MGFSLGKAVTAAAVGKAICAGFLAMDTRAEELVPQLKGTALGRSTTRGLLCMSSGAPIVLTGHALADAPIRLRLEDWVRFARWLKSESVNEGQSGDFLREATKTQVSNSDKRFGPRFDGYGYMFWTDNSLAPATFWATGMGGQRIGWSYDNDRMLIAFSNREDWMDPLYRLYKAWSELS